MLEKTELLRPRRIRPSSPSMGGNFVSAKEAENCMQVTLRCEPSDAKNNDIITRGSPDFDVKDSGYTCLLEGTICAIFPVYPD